GSIVTATVTGASNPATSEASWRVTPPSVGVNTPADTGVLPEITHAWYVRSAGSLGRSYAYRINVRVSGLRNARARALAPAPCPASAMVRVAGAVRTRAVASNVETCAVRAVRSVRASSNSMRTF